MKEILRENFLNKENVNKPDLENMLSTVHQSKSIFVNYKHRVLVHYERFYCFLYDE